ncbi:MAG: hypothetical protein LBO02_02135 [Holosporaceae bacterium]|jgi:SH3-like domain-containing protein|nr:hypothetical protein [Holosporaceae bacterium]
MRSGSIIFAFIISFWASARQFVSLKSSEINLRVGPGKEYPISWTFMKSCLPMMLIAEFNQWRKIKFVDRTEGWVHQNMISRKNTAIVVSEYAILYKYESNSQPIAKIEKNSVVNVLKNGKDLVKIEANKIKGWVKKQDLWGINED